MEAGRRKNIQWEECVCFCERVWVKDNEDLCPWLCLHGNLPTLILLYKLIQGKKKKKSEESQSVWWNPECRISRRMSRNLFCTALKEKKKKKFLSFLFFNFQLPLCFPAEEEDGDSPVYSVHCIRMWTHSYFLRIFRNSCAVFLRWMCASSVAAGTSISSQVERKFISRIRLHTVFLNLPPSPYFSTCKYGHVRHFGHCKYELEKRDIELFFFLTQIQQIRRNRDEGAGPHSLLCP